jgi:hypothetical protein
MRRPPVRHVSFTILPMAVALIAGAVFASTPDDGVAWLEWRVVVNNGMTVPGDIRTFNSYNQPSVNVDGLVVFRARSRGGATGGAPAHGVFSRHMALGTAVSTVFDRRIFVPFPNNLGTTFVEPPSFPRLDMWSNTVASRGNHPPAWEYILPNETETRGGTTGIYTNPFWSLISGASNLGAAPGFDFLAVPGTNPPIKFDVFPGAPAATDTATVVFKGNYSVSDPNDPSVTINRTGVYYRDLIDAPAGGTGSVIAIADAATAIPGTRVPFGAVAPPSAAGRLAVFTGWDNEWSPTVGGIYLAPLDGPMPPLRVLVRIGDRVPGEPTGTRFRNLGESLSFDGRFVAFWGTWGSATRTLVLQCPREGNRDRLEYCRTTHPSGFMTTVPVHQGIFVHDTKTGGTRAVAKSPDDVTDFIYWNFSGMVPGMTGHADDDGEPARWRSAVFVAVSGLVDDRHTDATFHAVFKARTRQVVGGAICRPARRSLPAHRTRRVSDRDAGENGHGRDADRSGSRRIRHGPASLDHGRGSGTRRVSRALACDQRKHGNRRKRLGRGLRDRDAHTAAVANQRSSPWRRNVFCLVSRRTRRRWC